VTLVLDTGPVYASLDRRDANHQRCRLLIEAADEPLAVPAPVLPEVDYFVAERLGVGAMLALLADVEHGAYVVEDLTHGDYLRVAELMDRYADLGLGFVDASVVTVAERLGEHKIATLDRRHFGTVRPRHIDAFQLLPEPSQSAR
jgi:predicted nucleic acid-binding protein